jgi:hypothetical protein
MIYRQASIHPSTSSESEHINEVLSTSIEMRSPEGDDLAGFVTPP